MRAVWPVWEESEGQQTLKISTVACLNNCFAQSENLRNLEIALLRIPRLRTLVARSRDCAIHLRAIFYPDAYVQKPSRGYERSYKKIVTLHVSVLQNSGVQAMTFLSLVENKPALLRT